MRQRNYKQAVLNRRLNSICTCEYYETEAGDKYTVKYCNKHKEEWTQQKTHH